MSDEVAGGVGPDLDGTALVMADRRGRIAYLFGYTARGDGRKGCVGARAAAFRRRHTAGFRAAWATGVFEPSGAVMIPVV